MKFISKSKTDYGVSAIDPFTIGHFLKGYILNMIMFIYFVPQLIDLLLILFISVVWELFENLHFIRLLIKFNKQRDSLINSISDVTFTIVGAIFFIFVSRLSYILILVISIVLGIVAALFFGIRSLNVIKSIFSYYKPKNSGDDRRNE